MNTQRLARTFGILFILTFLTSIPARLLFVGGLGGDWGDVRFVLGDGSETGMYWAAILEVLLIVTNIGTAVVLYPIAKRYSEIGALGYVTARVVECTFIAIGLLSLLSAVTLRQDFAGTAGVETAGASLVATYKWAFLFGPGLTGVLGTGLLVGYVMYRSGLVPRPMAMFGLVGGPLLAIGSVGVLFGVFETGSSVQSLLSVPEIIWEASLGVYAAWKGFRPGITSPETRRSHIETAVQPA